MYFHYPREEPGKQSLWTAAAAVRFGVSTPGMRQSTQPRSIEHAGGRVGVFLFVAYRYRRFGLWLPAYPFYIPTSFALTLVFISRPPSVPSFSGFSVHYLILGRFDDGSCLFNRAQRHEFKYQRSTCSKK